MTKEQFTKEQLKDELYKLIEKIQDMEELVIILTVVKNLPDNEIS